MKTKKKLSPHSLITVNAFFHRRRRLPLGAILVALALITATIIYTADPPTVQAVSTTILISEVESSAPAGGDAGEWFELVNVSNAPITLTGWTITDNGGTDTIPTITINPGEYVVIAADVTQFNTNHPLFPGTVVELPSSDLGNGLAQAGDRLELRDGGAVLVDAMSFGSDTTHFSLPATQATNNRTYQRVNTFDTDGSKDWTVATETPDAPAPIVPYFDNSSSAGDFDSVLDTGFIAGKTLTWSHTVGSGNNRVLVVGISTEVDNIAGLPGDRVSGVTYNGVAMTRIPGTSSRDTANRVGVEMFILINPPTGTANVVATILPSVNYVVGGSASFFNVNQTTPTRAVSIASSTTGSPTTTFTTVVSDIVVDTVATLPSGFLAPGAGQTDRWLGRPFFSTAFDVGAGSTEPVGTTSTTMNWTSNSQNWAIAAAALQPAAVTAVGMSDFTATQAESGVALRWQTGFEVNNLGFNLYREQRGKRTRLNPAIIAGSALLAGQGTRLTAGQSYSWKDRSFEPGEPVQYWLEDIDLDGTRTLHGPVAPVTSDNAQVSSEKQAVQLTQLNALQADTDRFITSYPLTQNQRTEEASPIKQAQPQQQAQASPAELLQRRNLASKFLRINGELLYAIVSELPPLDERVGSSPATTTTTAPAGNPVSYAPEDPLSRQQTLAASAAVKIAIRQTGWYRVSQAELLAAGINPNIDPSLLHLYADGVEQPIFQNGSPKQFGADSSIEFYGTGMDTPASDRRTYWLVVGSQPGIRINNQGINYSKWIDQDVSWITTDDSAPAPPSNANPATPAKPAGTFLVPGVDKPVRVGRWRAWLDNSTVCIFNLSPEKKTRKSPEKKNRKKKKAARKILRERSHALINRKSAQATQELSSSQGFAYVSERKERINYFSGLLNGEAENFFGPLVLSGSPTRQDLGVNNIDNSTSAQASLEIALQGLTAQAHQVRVSLNGTEVGVLSFADLEHPVARFSIPHSSLVAGNNAVTLVSQSGEADISLVDYVRLTYLHTYSAENDSLLFTSQHKTPFTVDGFTSPQIRVFDVTDTEAVAPVSTKVFKQGAGYSVKVAGGNGSKRTLLAVTESQIQHPAEIKANEPSTWAVKSNRADFVILTHRDFRDAVKPLADLRRSQGMEVSVVDVEDVYDEFSYGAKSPQAVKDFLSFAKGHWQLAPRYALLVGDSSLDPRNHLGLGNQDFVPTKLVDATVLETASDDALADSDGDGLADMALGRLPVKTVEQAQKVIGKIVSYAPGQPAYSALLVSDRKDGYDFEASNTQVRALLPQDLSITMVNRRDNSAEQVRSEVIGGINAGPLLVNYAGHGSSDIWTGAGILNSTDAAALSNGNRLPLFVIMTCLNGRFHDPFRETLSEALMRADQGGAIAVWASSGLTEPDAQSAMDQQLMRLLFIGSGEQSPTLGDAVRGAKAATTNVDVRRTWILFGDPTMRIR